MHTRGLTDRTLGAFVAVTLAASVVVVALTLALVSAQDPQIVTEGLLIASVILPNASDLYRRVQLRLRSAPARKAAHAEAR